MIYISYFQRLEYPPNIPYSESIDGRTLSILPRGRRTSLMIISGSGHLHGRGSGHAGQGAHTDLRWGGHLGRGHGGHLPTLHGLLQEQIHGGHFGTSDLRTYWLISGCAGHSVFSIYLLISTYSRHLYRRPELNPSLTPYPHAQPSATAAISKVTRRVTLIFIYLVWPESSLCCPYHRFHRRAWNAPTLLF